MDALHERRWPIQGAKAGVGIVHGLAEHSGRYEHVAAALNRAGYSVYAIDLRGHGQSPGFPGDVGDLDTNIADVVGFVSRVSGQHDETFLLAHSMGTLLSIPAVAEIPSGTLQGLVLSGTALMPGPATLESLGSGEGIPPELVSRDPDVVQAYKDDPLVFYDRVPDGVMANAMEATQRATAAIPLIRIPVLLIHGLADALCDVQGAQHVHVQLVGTDKTLKTYDGLYHEVLNEPEKDQVIADVVEWLDHRVESQGPATAS